MTRPRWSTKRLTGISITAQFLAIGNASNQATQSLRFPSSRSFRDCELVPMRHSTNIPSRTPRRPGVTLNWNACHHESVPAGVESPKLNGRAQLLSVISTRSRASRAAVLSAV